VKTWFAARASHRVHDAFDCVLRTCFTTRSLLLRQTCNCVAGIAACVDLSFAAPRAAFWLARPVSRSGETPGNPEAFFPPPEPGDAHCARRVCIFYLYRLASTTASTTVYCLYSLHAADLFRRCTACDA
jgi:hypothetical protein